MNCNQSYKYIGTEPGEEELAGHLKECPICAERIRLINQAMALLDEKVEIPSGLTEKVLQQCGQAKAYRVVPTIDLNKYLQLAAVILIGIFLGVLLGSRANSEIFLSKKEKKDKALIEYREIHHLNDLNSISRF